MSLESLLVKTFGLPQSPNENEIQKFCNKVLQEKQLTEARMEEHAKESFSGYGRGLRSLNESQADTIHDLLVLIRKKLGK